MINSDNMKIFFNINNSNKKTRSIPKNIKDDNNIEYEVIEQIGSGGASFIIKVKKKIDEVEFALKLLKNKPKNKKRTKYLKKEIEYIKDFEDTGKFIKIYGIGNIDGYEYYITDLADSDLTEFICDLDSSNEESLIGYIIDLAESLKLIHEKGYVHRDIKPQNILLFSGDLQISDFGMFTRVNEDCIIRGPKYWPSPELLSICGEDQHCSNKETDVFMLGCIFYFMYTKKYPIGNINIDEIDENMKMKPIIERMLAYNKANRIKDGIELYNEVKEILPK